MTVPSRGEVPEDGTALPQGTVPEKGRIELSAGLVYGHNSTSRNWGGAMLQACLPVHRCFDILLHTQFTTQTGACWNAAFRPKLPLPYGSLYADVSLYSMLQLDYGMLDAVGALSAGYSFDYLDVRAGVFFRGIFDITSQSDKSAGAACIVEPWNLLYRLAFLTRPSTSRWNVGGGITNCTPFEYERPWQPLAFINGFYRIGDHFRINADVTFKPTGMFHLVASFYGIRTSAGFTYIF